MRKPSITTVIACLALFLSLGGSALAASHYLITSTKQIKPNVLTSLRGKTGPAGAQGVAGAPGAPGAPGAAGTFSASDLSVVDGPSVVLCVYGGGSCDVGSSVATCPTGDTLVSGGYSGDAVSGAIVDNEPLDNSWEVVAANDAVIDVNFQAIAVCAS